jgi:hypothetical protein
MLLLLLSLITSAHADSGNFGVGGYDGYKVPVANSGTLPASGNNDSDVRVTNDDKEIYVWDAPTNTWKLVASPAAATAISGLISDVSATGPGSVVATIQPNVVSNSKLAKMPAYTIKANNTASAADPSDVLISSITQPPLTFTAPLVDTAGTIAINGDVADNKLSFVDNTDATKKLSTNLSGAGTGTTTTIAPQSTISTTIHIPQPLGNGGTPASTGRVLVQDEASGYILGAGITAPIGGGNSMFQLANATQANRAQIKLHSYVNAVSVAGVSTLTSQSGTIGVNAAIGASQDYSKWTAQASPSAGASPITGTWAFKSASSGIGGNQVPSDFHLQMMNQAGVLGDRFYLTSEGALKLPGYTAGFAKFDASGNVTSGALASTDLPITGSTPITYTAATGVISAANFIGDNFGGSVAGIVPAASSGQKEGYYLGSDGTHKYVDVSKNRYNPFSFINQTAAPAGLVKNQDVTISDNKKYAYVSSNNTVVTLTIYDISNQYTPVQKGTLTLQGTYKVCTKGNYIYIPSSGGSNMYVVDATNPNTPTVVGTVAVSGGAGSLYSCAVSADNNSVYLATQSKGLTVIDVTTKTAPVQIYQEGGTLNKSFGVAISGDTVYTTSYQTATPWTVRYFKTWDVTTPSAPSLLNTYTLPANTKPNSITVSGNTAYVTDTNQMLVHMLDITTPAAPVFLASLTPSASFNSGFSAQVSGNVAYLPSGSNATYGGVIDAFDITNLAAPVKIGSIKTNVANSVFGGIAISKGYIFVGDSGVAPGSAGGLDVFSTASETMLAGLITAGKIVLPGGDIQTQINAIVSGGRVSNTVSANFTIPTLTKDYVLNVNSSAGPITITMPDATLSANFCTKIKNIGSPVSNVTMSATGIQTIDGLPTFVETTINESAEICSVGGNWFVY